MGTQTACAGLPGTFARGGEAQAQEGWAGVLGALPSCQCSPQGQSLGSPPSRSSMLWSQEQDQTVKLSVQMHLLEMSSRL